MRDEEMIRQIRQGRTELLDPLIDRYYQDIFRFCYYRTGQEQTAYDCAQETFLRMLRFLGSCEETRRFKSWLLSIALNVCRDYYRAASGKEVPLAEEKGEEYDADGCFTGQYMPESGRGNGEKPYGQAEDRQVIRQCLMRLPEFQREAIVLYFYSGYKVREIAGITGVALPTAKSRLRQGMEKLKKIFEEEGLHEADW